MLLEVSAHLTQTHTSSTAACLIPQHAFPSRSTHCISRRSSVQLEKVIFAKLKNLYAVIYHSQLVPITKCLALMVTGNLLPTGVKK